MTSLARINNLTVAAQTRAAIETTVEQSASSAFTQQIAAAAAQQARNVETSPAAGKADFVSGQLGIDLVNGVPGRIKYFDKTGQQLTSSSFNAESILRLTKKFGIDLSDLQGLGEQLDAKNIGYRPYELYKGTGSDHGINFDDLIAKGLGTAYDWRQDNSVAEKGPSAAAALAQAQQTATDNDVTLNPEVTSEKGIDPAYMTPLLGKDKVMRSVVVANLAGQTAAWLDSVTAARQYANQNGGQILNLSASSVLANIRNIAG